MCVCVGPKLLNDYDDSTYWIFVIPSASDDDYRDTITSTGYPDSRGVHQKSPAIELGGSRWRLGDCYEPGLPKYDMAVGREQR